MYWSLGSNIFDTVGMDISNLRTHFDSILRTISRYDLPLAFFRVDSVLHATYEMNGLL